MQPMRVTPWLFLVLVLPVAGCDLLVESMNSKNWKEPTEKQKQEWDRQQREQEFEQHMELQDPNYGKRKSD
jgi:hypothetical protein